MKVKINNCIYDSKDQPILLILDQQDKYNIANMKKESLKYCAFPMGNFDENEKEIKEFMQTTKKIKPIMSDKDFLKFLEGEM